MRGTPNRPCPKCGERVMMSRVIYPVFCPECGEIHKSRVRDTVTVGKGESDE